jgi:hypothetical protein
MGSDVLIGRSVLSEAFGWFIDCCWLPLVFRGLFRLFLAMHNNLQLPTYVKERARCKPSRAGKSPHICAPLDGTPRSGPEKSPEKSGLFLSAGVRRILHNNLFKSVEKIRRYGNAYDCSR